MQDAETYRLKALACAKLLDEVDSESSREYLRHMEKSYLLLARNAEWLTQTDAFLREQYRRMYSDPVSERAN